MNDSHIRLVNTEREGIEMLQSHPSVPFANPAFLERLERNRQSLLELGEGLTEGIDIDETMLSLENLRQELESRRQELDSVATSAEIDELRRLQREVLAHVVKVRSHPEFFRLVTKDSVMLAALEDQEQAANAVLLNLELNVGVALPQADASAAILSCRSGLEKSQNAYRILEEALANSDEVEAFLPN